MVFPGKLSTNGGSTSEFSGRHFVVTTGRNCLWKRWQLGICNGIVANCRNPPRLSPASFNHRIATACEKTVHSLRQKNERTWKKQHVPSATVRQNYPQHSATTSSVGQQGSRTRKDLPRTLELSFDAPSPAQVYVKLFVTFLRHFITLGELISLAICVFWHSKSSIGNTYVFALLTFDEWIFCCYTVNPRVILGDSGWISFCANLWMRPSFGLEWSRYLLECSPISAVQQCWFLILPQFPCCFARN